MPVKVVLLGRLRDLAEHECFALPDPLRWADLLQGVGTSLRAELADDRVRVACGGRVLADKRGLDARDGDEVALLPPVSGG